LLRRVLRHKRERLRGSAGRLQRELHRILATEFKSSRESRDNFGSGNDCGASAVLNTGGNGLLAGLAATSISKEIGRTAFPASKLKIQSLTAVGKGRLISLPQASETITLGPMTPE